ncbi:hypothetical protein VARIO8X_60350 [Burkholderiales bacterium 8X]|nr:hypothetical protein VARIO8X_60350 [Burkholderiales bacterium 8X]
MDRIQSKICDRCARNRPFGDLDAIFVNGTSIKNVFVHI